MASGLRVDGKRVLITGAGAGIGLVMARTFMEAGARVRDDAGRDLGRDRARVLVRVAKESMKRFWAYFESATALPGALTVREKALIALAVAHAKQCPYCIDSFTDKCLSTGATVEAMHEAVHVAAAMAAGIDLVHGVQMQNALRKKGAIA